MKRHTPRFMGWGDHAAEAVRVLRAQRAAWRSLPASWRWGALGVTGIAVLALTVVLNLDWSRRLSPAELAGFEAWAADSHAPEVVAALQGARQDRKVTVYEANAVIEVAKAAAIPPGLMEPVGWE